MVVKYDFLPIKKTNFTPNLIFFTTSFYDSYNILSGS